MERWKTRARYDMVRVSALRLGQVAIGFDICVV